MPILPGRKVKTKRDYTGDPDEFRLTLVEHLEELRDRIIRAVVYLVVGWVIGWVLFPYLYEYMTQVIDRAIVPNLPKGTKYIEVVLNVTDLFMLKFRLSLTIGLVIVFPFLVNEVWGFVAPALKQNEQLPVKRLAPLSLFLFALGAGFCWLIIPSAISWFVSFSDSFPGIDITQTAGSMIYFILKMMLAFGIGFQLPLVVYALGAVGLLSAEVLVQYWRQAATVIFVAAAIITPSNDAFSMLMMAIPMVILFLLSVYFVRLTQRKKERLAAAEEAAYVIEPTPEDDEPIQPEATDEEAMNRRGRSE